MLSETAVRNPKETFLHYKGAVLSDFWNTLSERASKRRMCPAEHAHTRKCPSACGNMQLHIGFACHSDEKLSTELRFVVHAE